MRNYKKLLEYIVCGRKKEVAELTKYLIEMNKPATEILHEGLMPGMAIVGQKYQNGEFFVPEMLVAARAFNAGMEILKPVLEKSQMQPIAKVLMGTVKGDFHDLGKNLVSSVLRGVGFEVIDAGIDVSAEKFVDLATENEVQIVGLSAMLTTTMLTMKDIIDAFETHGLREKMKIIIGGAPVSASFADKIGADGYGKDVSAAIQLAQNFVGVSQ